MVASLAWIPRLDDLPPVCVSGFVAFARAAESFATLDCELCGRSVDSAYGHIAWLGNIRESFGVEVSFPVIEDVSMRVPHACGMVHPGATETSTVRATLVIDPDGMVRAMIWYPLSTGRSVDEVLRPVTALQTAADSVTDAGAAVDRYFRTRSL